MQIAINQINDLGQVYAKSLSGKNIFVENGVIGDVAQVEIIKENSKFISAKIKNLIKPSESRVESPCKFFEKCGGCDFLNYEESFYQETKSKILLNILHKNGISLELRNIEFHWLGKRQRRKINLQIDENNYLGFFNKNSNQLVKIDDCLLVEKAISDLIPKLQNLLQLTNKGLYSSISITLFDNSTDLIFKTTKQLNNSQKNLLINFAKENHLNIYLEAQNQELITIYQIAKSQIFIKNLKLDLHSQIFIQATKSTPQIVIEKISQLILQEKNIKKIIDFYSGFGAYSFAIADSILSAILFEGEKKMINLVNINAKNLNFSNKIKAFQRDLFLNPISNKELNNFDLAIINPPRNGALPQATQIAKSSIKNVVMISCNPSTFARDSKILIESGFEIRNIAAIDQFYSNANFEVIAIFRR